MKILCVFLVFGFASLASAGPASIQNKESNIVESFKKLPPVPPHKQFAKYARYIVHVVDWTSLATISTHEKTLGYPFTSVTSLSDGAVNNATGVPYMYLTKLDISVQDLQKDPRASLSMTLAQTEYCKEKHVDPENPLCAHVILTGKIVEVPEEKIPEARTALFSRHQEMKYWPANHGFFFAQLDIEHIYILDFFGGIGEVPVDEYYAAQPF